MLLTEKITNSFIKSYKVFYENARKTIETFNYLTPMNNLHSIGLNYYYKNCSVKSEIILDIIRATIINYSKTHSFKVVNRPYEFTEDYVISVKKELDIDEATKIMMNIRTAMLRALTRRLGTDVENFIEIYYKSFLTGEKKLFNFGAFDGHECTIEFTVSYDESIEDIFGADEQLKLFSLLLNKFNRLLQACSIKLGFKIVKPFNEQPRKFYTDDGHLSASAVTLQYKNKKIVVIVRAHYGLAIEIEFDLVGYECMYIIGSSTLKNITFKDFLMYELLECYEQWND